MTSLGTNDVSSPLLKVEGTYAGITYTYYVISTPTEIKYRWEEREEGTTGFFLMN